MDDVDEKLKETPLNAAPLAPTRRTWLLYLSVMGSLCLLVYAAPFAVLLTSYYDKVTPDWEYPVFSYAFKAIGQNADVVIYGDSSADHSIDPMQMSRELGVKVVNLPSYLGELYLLHDFALRSYLKADKPPRVIVFYLAPWNMNAGKEDIHTQPLFSAMEILFRYGSTREKAAFVLAHPMDAFQFPWMFYRTGLIAHASGIPKAKEMEKFVVESHGHTPSYGGSLHEVPDCKIPDQYLQRMGDDWIMHLKETYATAQTKVLVMEAPFAHCVNAAEVLKLAQKDAPAILPTPMDPELFMKDGYYVHLYANGVSSSTENLIQQVRPLLSEPSTAGRR